MCADKETNPRTELLQFRYARLEDVEAINAFLEPIDYGVGAHIIRLYFENSECRWRVATNTRGEIVGFDGGHILPLNEIYFGFGAFVDEKYQGRGIMRRIGSNYLQNPFMSNASARAMQVFPQMGKFDSKLVGYTGVPRVDLLLKPGGNAGAKICSVQTDEDIHKVVAYDRESVFLLDRDRFMRAWCVESKPNSNPYARTLMAEVDGRTVGFGVIRGCTDFYALQPLYADSAEVAAQLLDQLIRLFVEECGPEAELYVCFDAKNYFMMRFCHEQKFEQWNSEVRHYSRGAEVIKKYCMFERMYSSCDYWPV